MSFFTPRVSLFFFNFKNNFLFQTLFAAVFARAFAWLVRKLNKRLLHFPRADTPVTSKADMMFASFGAMELPTADAKVLTLHPHNTK